MSPTRIDDVQHGLGCVESRQMRSCLLVGLLLLRRRTPLVLKVLRLRDRLACVNSLLDSFRKLRKHRTRQLQKAVAGQVKRTHPERPDLPHLVRC